MVLAGGLMPKIMARPEKNTVDYFPHMVGVGKKMFFIEKQYGNDGYAAWYKILEKLCETEYHFLNFNIEEEVMFIASKCNVTEDRLLSIINDLVRLGSFDKELWDKCKVIWCQYFIDSIQDAYLKRKNKCIDREGLLQVLSNKGILNGVINTVKPSENTQTKVEHTIVEETKEDKSKKEEIKYFYRIKGKVFNEKISEFIKREKSIFLDTWGMQNGKEKIPPIFDKIDAEYNGYDFDDENHVQNTFKSTHDKIAKFKSNGKSTQTNATTVLPAGKKWDD